MSDKKYGWPDHYPDSCPPEDAEYTSGPVFRFTSRVKPKKRDFLSYYELRPDSDWGDKACQSRGLSVYISEKDCRNAQTIVPALRKKELCVAEMEPEYGVIASTQSQNTSNHKTLWPLFSAQELAEIFIPIGKMSADHD